MQIFFWKKNKQIDTFSASLADEVFNVVQPELFKEYFEGFKDKKSSIKTKKKVDSLIDGMARNIVEFSKVNSLGIYGNARMHQKIRSRLEELGYDPVYVWHGKKGYCG